MAALGELFTNSIEPANILGTCYDSEKVLHEKYGTESRENIDACIEAGYEVLYAIDGTKLTEKHVKNRKFSKIVFNFPHSGAGIKDKVCDCAWCLTM